jgi:hypothetical protein
LALALLVTAPLLKPGYLLLRDAVSTPRSYLSNAALGLSEAAPRALPQDFAVAIGSWAVGVNPANAIQNATGQKPPSPPRSRSTAVATHGRQPYPTSRLQWPCNNRSAT